MKSALFVAGFVILVLFIGGALSGPTGPTPRDEAALSRACKLTEHQIRQLWGVAGRFKDEAERTQMTAISVKAAEDLCLLQKEAPPPLPAELQQLSR